MSRKNTRVLASGQSPLFCELRCTCCGRELPAEQFYRTTKSKDRHGRIWYCKECSCEQTRRYNLRKKLAAFKITVEDYEAMLTRQGGACAICGSVYPGTNTKGQPRTVFCIDHDHVTGLARGLLCNNCNLGIANFRDDAFVVDSAVAYLQKGGR